MGGGGVIGNGREEPWLATYIGSAMFHDVMSLDRS
jgi:hypothetical protein